MQIYTLQVIFNMIFNLPFSAWPGYHFITTDCCHMTWDSAHPDININIWMLSITMFFHNARLRNVMPTSTATFAYLHCTCCELYKLWKLLWKDIEVGRIKQTKYRNVIFYHKDFTALWNVKCSRNSAQHSGYLRLTSKALQGWRCDVTAPVALRSKRQRPSVDW